MSALPQVAPNLSLRHLSRRAVSLTVGLCLALATAAQVWAGEYNAVLDIGDTAPAWKSLPGTDGKQHSLSDLAKKKAIVVVFTCNSCPYAVDYEDRLIAFQEKYCGPQQPVALVAINVNRIEEDGLPAMKARAEEKGFRFPYLFDESQDIARKYGAIRTPEFFVLGPDRKVVYMGSMDDNTKAGEVQQSYVELAVKSILEDSNLEVTETPPIGCSIRFVRKRRGRGSR